MNPSSEAGPMTGAGRVLVVDDDPGNRMLLADWLGAYGHKVATASDGLAALKAVELDPPDAILLDVMMPGLDGFKVCERLKSNPETAGIPVLLLTALHEREDRLRGMRAGANDFLMKPADLPYVLLRVRNAVQLRRLHNEMKNKLDEIHRQENLKESLLHMVIHDLRTPLAGMEGFLQLLQMSAGSKLEERPAHYLKQALHATHNLAHHIDLLLDIHRLEEGHMPVQAIDHDLGDVVNKALEPLRALLETRRFCVQDSAQPLHAICDPGLLSRVLSNLIGNAIAFTAPQVGKICIRFQPEAGRVRVEVVDNGPGIDPLEQQIIFEKFRQGREHVRERSSGLGLAFCKLAMEAQHGTIGVDSQPGVGSKFWFEVPVPA